jgi:hypothetical protein
MASDLPAYRIFIAEPADLTGKRARAPRAEFPDQARPVRDLNVAEALLRRMQAGMQ